MRQRCGAKGFDSNTCYESPNMTSTTGASPTSTSYSSKPSQQAYTRTYNSKHNPTRSQTYTTHQTTYTTSNHSSPRHPSEPVTVTFTGNIPPEITAKFRDPSELFKAMFTKEYGRNPDFLDDNDDIRFVLETTPAASPTRRSAATTSFKEVKSPKKSSSTSANSFIPISKKISDNTNVPKSTRSAPQQFRMTTTESSSPPKAVQQSMCSSTRQVRHADGRMETITETTITWSDGRTETKRESSLQEAASSHRQTSRHPMMSTMSSPSQSQQTFYRIVKT